MKTSIVTLAVIFASCVGPEFQAAAQQAGPDTSTISHSAFRPVIPEPSDEDEKAEKKNRHLKVKIYPFYNKLPSTGRCLVAVELDIDKEWHINANPANPDWMKPTVVSLKSKHGIKISKIKYPKHHELQVEGAPAPYHVYDGKVIVYCELDIKDISAEKTVELEFHVAFQGCNSENCLNPDSIVMKGKLPVAGPREKLKKVNSEKFPKPKKKPATNDK